MNTDTHTEVIIDLLKRRGFLIEKKDGKWVLSDNSHEDDERYLNEIMSTCGTGRVRDGEIEIDADSDLIRLKEYMFRPVPSTTMGVDNSYGSIPRQYLRYHVHTRKIPLKFLEANIARYIKALSACGIHTYSCCDDNHPGKDYLFIELNAPMYTALHDCLWKNCLQDKFLLLWKNYHTGISLKENRAGVYRTLNEAAEYLCENRHFFQKARMDAASWLKKTYIKHHSKEEIAERFLKKFAEKLQAAPKAEREES